MLYKNLSDTGKMLIKISAVISLILGILGALLINDNAPYAEQMNYVTLVGKKVPFLIGLLLGEILTVIKIILIDRSCSKALDMEVSQGKLYASGQYFVRFILTGAVLIAALLRPEIGFLGCLLGIAALQLAAIMVPVVEKNKRKGVE